MQSLIPPDLPLKSKTPATNPAATERPSFEGQSFPFAVWLVPSKNESALLREIIDSFSQRFNTPRFEPHMTLCSGRWGDDLLNLKKAAAMLCRNLAPATLAVEEIGQTDSYFTFFYLKLSDEIALPLFRKAISVIKGSGAPAIGPHVSLIYSDSNIRRSSLRKKLLKILPDELEFDSLQLIIPANGSWYDIAHWTKKFACKL